MNIPRFFRTAALAAAAFLSLSGAANAQALIFSETANWDYLHPTNGIDPALADPDFNSTWFQTDGSYNGPAFTTDKPGPFSYGGIDYWTGTGTFIGANGANTAPAAGSRYSAYFKKQFTTTSDFGDTLIELLVDDGAVIYIDGIERKRVNMTGATGVANAAGDDYQMLSDEFSDETALRTPISLGTLTAGPHTIAISVHNVLATSSDLGLFVRLYGIIPDAILKVIRGGVAEDVAAVPGFTGWAKDAPYNFFLNSMMGQFSIESQPVAIQFAGEAYFSMEMYCYEVSGTSNFEVPDEFSAKLLLTLDDDSQREVSLLPPDLDLDGDGKLTGEEFNPGLLAVTKSVVAGRQLHAVIPANAKSVSLRMTGANDTASGSETLSFGGAVISDVLLDSDADGDGVNLAAEMFSGTNPADSDSFLRISAVSSEFDATLATPAWVFRTTFPVIAGKSYAAEKSFDGGTTWEFIGFLTAADTVNLRVSATIGATLPGRYFERIRCVP